MINEDWIPICRSQYKKDIILGFCDNFNPVNIIAPNNQCFHCCYLDYVPRIQSVIKIKKDEKD